MSAPYALAVLTLLATWAVGGGRGPILRLLPSFAALSLTMPAGVGYALVTAGSCALWLLAFRRIADRRRRDRMADACQEPLQAMFEQASLLGNAEHCAVGATGSCPEGLRYLWQLAIADWARGASADEAFARVAHRHGLPPLERLARALALTRHTGTPLARHLAVLLEDVAEDLRLHREARSAVWPFALATAFLAGAVLIEVVVIGMRGGGPLPGLAALAGLTAGGAPLIVAEVAG